MLPHLPKKVLSVAILAFVYTHGALPPDLPGIDVGEFETPKTQVITPSQPDKKCSSNEARTWSAPDIETQVNQAAKLISMGMGAIFVPRMTEVQLEPEITILNEKGDEVLSGQVGEKISLEPGNYHILVGSGPERLRTKIPVKVNEDRTSVISPIWGGMVIETRSTEGDLISESYEISRLRDGESFGKGMGQPQERLKDINTWILPAGIYRISRMGETQGSLTDYITVQLNSGELTRVEVVFDPNTGSLVSGGVRLLGRKIDGQSPWTFGTRIGGNVSAGVTIAENEMTKNYLAILSDLRLLARYDYMYYYGHSELRLRNSFQWLSEKDKTPEMLVTADAIQFQSSWMRRVRDWIGPYGRVSAWSHILDQNFKHKDSTVNIMDLAGEIVKTIPKDQSFKIRPPGYPLRLGEGVGLSMRIASGTKVEILAQSGMAWRQQWNRNVLVHLNEQKTEFGPGENLYTWGNENQLIMRFFIGNYLTIDMVGEVFFPRFDPDLFQIEELSFDFRLALIRNLELSYQYELVDRRIEGLKVSNEPRFKHENTLQLRFFFNY